MPTAEPSRITAAVSLRNYLVIIKSGTPCGPNGEIYKFWNLPFRPWEPASPAAGLTH